MHFIYVFTVVAVLLQLFADIHADCASRFDVVAVDVEQGGAFSDNLINIKVADFAVFPHDHPVGFAFFQQLDGTGAEHCCQNAVGGSRIAGTLGVAERGNTGLKFFAAFVDFRAQIMTDAAVNRFAYFVGGGSNMLSVFAFDAFGNDNQRMVAAAAGNGILFFLAAFFIFWGLIKKRDVYEDFIDGAKEGFKVAVTIIPYLVAMLTAIAVFRASGMFDLLLTGLENMFVLLGVDTGFVPALPTALMKPLSGSGARAMMIEAMQTYGADSFAGFVASVVQGSTETTFYVLAVYFGAVKVVKTRSALPCALLADLAGITAAVVVSYYFFES